MTIVVIASPFRANLDTNSNLTRLIEAQRKVEKHSVSNVQQTTGYYKEDAQSEASYEQGLMFPINPNSLAAIKDIFFNQFEQDCILVMNPNTQEAGLLFPDGSTVEIGKFQSVNHCEAMQAQAWTFWQNKYWICK